MEGEACDFEDWEVLHHSYEIGSVNSMDSLGDAGTSEAINGDSEGMIRTNHFSIDSQSMVEKTECDASVEGSVDSDNPSWIDPGSETRFPKKVSDEFWPDSGSDLSDDRKFSEFEDKHELGSVRNAKSQLGLEGFGEIGAGGEHFVEFWSDSCGIGPTSMEFGNFKHDTKVATDHSTNSPEGSDVAEEDNGGDVTASVEGSVAIGAGKPSGGEEKKSVVWWKVPFEFLKYYAFRVSPMWTFSMAAAVMGFVILRRRLYKMKQKSQSLQLNVTLDNKKVSQFMSRTARLNEAFSVVKRVPVIRPSLPAAGVTPWPVISLR